VCGVADGIEAAERAAISEQHQAADVLGPLAVMSAQATIYELHVRGGGGGVLVPSFM